MSRSPNKVFSKKANTSGRRDLIDYDYLENLDKEATEFLAKFTSEYYAADFKRHDTFARKEDIIKVCENELVKIADKMLEDNTEKQLRRLVKSADKWSQNLERIKKIKKTYIQINNNKPKKHNLDLRKCRSIKLYYKMENGRYTEDTAYKYDQPLHDNPELLKDCNDRNNANQPDIFSVQKPASQDSNQYYLDTNASTDYTPEEYLIWAEIEEEIDEWENV